MPHLQYKELNLAKALAQRPEKVSFFLSVLFFSFPGHLFSVCVYFLSSFHVPVIHR